MLSRLITPTAREGSCQCDLTHGTILICSPGSLFFVFVSTRPGTCQEENWLHTNPRTSSAASLNTIDITLEHHSQPEGATHFLVNKGPKLFLHNVFLQPDQLSEWVITSGRESESLCSQVTILFNAAATANRGNMFHTTIVLVH